MFTAGQNEHYHANAANLQPPETAALAFYMNYQYTGGDGAPVRHEVEFMRWLLTAGKYDGELAADEADSLRPSEVGAYVTQLLIDHTESWSDEQRIKDYVRACGYKSGADEMLTSDKRDVTYLPGTVQSQKQNPLARLRQWNSDRKSHGFPLERSLYNLDEYERLFTAAIDRTISPIPHPFAQSYAKQYSVGPNVYDLRMHEEKIYMRKMELAVRSSTDAPLFSTVGAIPSQSETFTLTKYYNLYYLKYSYAPVRGFKRRPNHIDIEQAHLIANAMWGYQHCIQELIESR